MIDVIIIGAGLSGLMAAYKAARAGLKVRVIAKGLGTMHWGAGTIDVLGYLPGEEKTGVVQRPLDNLDQLEKAQPGHPYARLGKEKLEAAFDQFLQIMEEIGLPYHRAANAGDNLLLPSPAGAIRPVYLAPTAQIGGDLSRDEPMLLVGFKGLRDFYPQLIADNLSKQGYKARAALIDLDLLTDRRDFNTVHLAQGLENPTRRSVLINEIRRLAQPGERIGLPAVLGEEGHNEVFSAMQNQLKTTLFEIPTLPPSVPGIRLYKALRKRLEHMGVRVEAGMEVEESHAAAAENGTPGSVKWVATETSARPLKHRAPKFVLATGGILGGGFNSDHDGRVWETIFNLPLTTPQKRTQWFRPSFLNPEGHPVFRGGVTVDENWQPVDGDGRVLYGNLWAAGNLLAHSDTIQERSMEGAAVATGIAAAEALLAAA